MMQMEPLVNNYMDICSNRQKKVQILARSPFSLKSKFCTWSFPVRKYAFMRCFFNSYDTSGVFEH